MNKQGHITAVGLGPGDAELLTIKGYKTLKNADIIFYPASSVDNENIQSFSLKILAQLDLNVPVHALEIPMNSKKRGKYYKEAYLHIKQTYEEGKNIVIVSEGDILFYSTFGYLLEYIQNDNLQYSLVPGIPAFIAAGSQGNFPLVDGSKQIRVIACPKSIEELHSERKEGETLVVMKLSKIKNWDSFFENTQSLFLYVERVGTEHQFVTGNPNDLIGRRIPYFALLIIYG